MNLSSIMTDPHLRQVYIAGVKFRYDLDKMAWYDSTFIRRFETAKRVLALFRPQDLDRFVAEFEILRTRPDFKIQHLDPVFDDETFAKVIATVRALPQTMLETHENGNFGRDVVHDLPYFTELQAALTQTVSEMAGEAVVPCYNFLSLYKGSGICRPHMDEPTAKWTLDICLEQSVGWPIHFSRIVDWPDQPPPPGWSASQIIDDPDLAFVSHVLEPNRALLFAGSSQWHHRQPIPQVTDSFCTLLFFHYAPAGAKAVLYPELWHSHFGIPELEVLNTVFPAPETMPEPAPRSHEAAGA